MQLSGNKQALLASATPSFYHTLLVLLPPPFVFACALFLTIYPSIHPSRCTSRAASQLERMYQGEDKDASSYTPFPSGNGGNAGRRGDGRSGVAAAEEALAAEAAAAAAAQQQQRQRQLDYKADLEAQIRAKQSRGMYLDGQSNTISTTTTTKPI